MNKKLSLLIVLFILLSLLPVSPCRAMGTVSPSPTGEVEIIEKIATQNDEVGPREGYDMKVLVEIPWGSKPGELGVRVVEGMAVVPDRLAIDQKENIYIFDKANNRINKYSKFGKYIREYKIDSFTLLPSKRKDKIPEIVNNDVDMGVDESGNVYILNATAEKIRKINPSGKLIDEMPAPARASFIRVKGNGRVQAVRYKDSNLEVFDSSSQKLKSVSGFETPAGFSIVFDEQKSVNEPQYIRIISQDGNMLKKIKIASPYELYSVNLIGTDAANNIYLAVERQSDVTENIEVGPGEFKTVRLVGYFILKFNSTGEKQLAEIKYLIEEGEEEKWVPGYGKCFSVGKKGDVYLLVMFGNAYSRDGKFKVLQWERKG